MNIVTHRSSTVTGPAPLLMAGLIVGSAVGPGFAGEAAPADAQRRLYVTGIVGSSLGGDAGPKGNGSIGDLASPTLGGDAAIGVSIDRSQSIAKGAVRLEFEGRTRSRSAAVDEGRSGASTTDWSTTNWSTMANLWRDVPITEHLGGYAGGGIGAGGFHDAAGRSHGAFTWQVGGGMTYALNDRLTLDVGYRALPAAFTGRGPAGQADAPVGELLFSVRLYEPFRGWLRD